MKLPTIFEGLAVLISIIAVSISIGFTDKSDNVDNTETSTIISQESYIQELENVIKYQQAAVQEYRVQNRDSLFVIVSNNNMIKTYNGLKKSHDDLVTMIDTTVTFTPIQKGQIELEKRASRMRGQYELIEELVKKQ